MQIKFLFALSTFLYMTENSQSIGMIFVRRRGRGSGSSNFPPEGPGTKLANASVHLDYSISKVAHQGKS